MKKVSVLIFLILCGISLPVLADDPPGSGGSGSRDHGTLGGDQGGVRLGEGEANLEDALRQSGIIQGSNSSGSGQPATSPGGTRTRTQNLPGGGTETETYSPDGSRTITYTGRSQEPTNLTMVFDKDGHVIKQDSETSDGRVDTMTYSPRTGVRNSSSYDPNTGTRVDMVSNNNGNSTMTITNPARPTTTIVEDPQGNRTETTPKSDGGKTVVTIPRGGPSTTTEYGADGKPDSSTTVNRDRWGNFQNRVVTEYDANGNPTRTQVLRPRRYRGEYAAEETEYWPGTSIPKRTVRRSQDGNITEMIYYDKNGKETRRSNAPGHTPSTEQPFYITPGPQGDFLHLRGGASAAAGSNAQPPRVSSFDDSIGVLPLGQSGLRPEAAPFGHFVDTTGIVGFDTQSIGDQDHGDEWDHSPRYN